MAADTNIFVNLPVKDLERSKEFFGKLGFTFNPQFTDDNAACMIIGEKIFSMLIAEPYFKTFTPKAIADATKTSEVLIALSCASRDEVGRMVQKAVAAGGKTYNEAKDHGFMLQHGFEDPDGHIWEVFYMDPSFVQPG
jgi:predicted lactoylglutathione lyase